MDEEYRKNLIRAYRPRFGHYELGMLCMCWSLDTKTGILSVTPRVGVSIEYLKDNIVPVGYLIQRLPESECAFAKLKR